MRLWLPEGPFPGAPATGPALLARSRQESGPVAYVVPGPGRGSSRYVETEVIDYCRRLWPPRIRKALAVLRAVDKAREDTQLDKAYKEHMEGEGPGEAGDLHLQDTLNILADILAAGDEP